MIKSGDIIVVQETCTSTRLYVFERYALDNGSMLAAPVDDPDNSVFLSKHSVIGKLVDVTKKRLMP